MPHRRVPDLIDQLYRTPYQGSPKHGLNKAQWAALRFFNTAAAPERTSTGFARAQATTKGTASQTILSLLRKGLLGRKPMPGDGRSHRVFLTPRGLAVLQDDPQRDLVRAISELPPERAQSLLEHLTELFQHIKTEPPQMPAE